MSLGPLSRTQRVSRREGKHLSSLETYRLSNMDVLRLREDLGQQPGGAKPLASAQSSLQWRETWLWKHGLKLWSGHIPAR